MTEVTITDQERRLLDLIARGEAVRGADPYTSLWPSTSEPNLVQMTIAEVQRFQAQRVEQGFDSSACGRYQFIQTTLREATNILEVDPLRTRYTADVQDALIIGILKRYRRLNEWLAGDPAWPTDKFMVKLAQEFASMPVPYAMQGANRRVQKGESYYAGDSLNRSNHDPDTLYRELEDIRTGGVGASTTIPVNADGPSGVVPATGTTPRAQVAAAAAGVGVGCSVGGNAGARPIPNRSLLAASGAVYNYKTIDPLDDRYDFRTGEKIKDIGVHGVAPAAASPVINGNIGPALVATTNSGAEPPIQGALDGLSAAQSELNNALTGGLSSAIGAFDSSVLRQVRSLDISEALTGLNLPDLGNLSLPNISNLAPGLASAVSDIQNAATGAIEQAQNSIAAAQGIAAAAQGAAASAQSSIETAFATGFGAGQVDPGLARAVQNTIGASPLSKALPTIRRDGPS